MTVFLKKSKGLLITALDKATIIGSVSSAVINPETNQIVGFKLTRGKSKISGDQAWLATEQIKKIGIDMVLIAMENKIQNHKIDGIGFDQLIGMPVSSKDGRALGQLRDLWIDDKTWQIIGMKLENQMQMPVATDELVIGSDMLLVQSGVELINNRKPKKNGPKVTVSISQDISSQTTKVMKKGEALVKHTSTVMRSMLRGSEANLAKVRHNLANKKTGHTIKPSVKKSSKK